MACWRATGPAADSVATLRAYLAELASPTRTARRLGVHTNTVVKRLERIEAIRGEPIDPSSLSLHPWAATPGRAG